jgi:hypothetical protein
MKIYVLQASLNNQITTQAIPARDTFSAKVLAVHKINACHISDKRYAKGEITLKDPEGKVVWKLAEIIEVKKKERGE